ncbi:MAG: hypothetical protein B6D68_02230 [spirochete symbiont of Stewartia floridana]|nr:MAG: hypothetical protein B6D68_02230 [spirochete symbiont of Stewartia floridana]
MKILISAGATQEPIDEVRHITNFSSGKTGAALAEFLAPSHFVTFLHGISSAQPVTSAINIKFQSFFDLDALFQRHLAENTYDLIIHTAAVSDYSVSCIELNGKRYKPAEIPKISSHENLVIRTRRNFKIIDRLKEYALSNPAAGQPPILAGFKLTNTPDRKQQKREVMELLKHSPADLVIHNDLYEMRYRGEHRFTVYKDHQMLHQDITLDDLAGEILHHCSSGLKA